jgi:hypothetical protein
LLIRATWNFDFVVILCLYRNGQIQLFENNHFKTISHYCFHINSSFSSTNNFAQTLSRMCSLSGRMNIARVNIEFFTGFKKIKQRRISFVLCYLRVKFNYLKTIILKPFLIIVFTSILHLFYRIIIRFLGPITNDVMNTVTTK